MRLYILICLVVSINYLQAKTIIVPRTRDVVFGFEKGKRFIYPGDTILLEAGARDAIQFTGLLGSKSKYITIINADNLCEITSNKHPYGISMRGCKYVRLCGTGASKYPYGIKISGIKSRGAGLGISDKSSDIEISYIEIAAINGPGILCKTDPDCIINQHNFTQYNTIIHDTYIHNTATEGMYIGNSAYTGEKIVCSGKETIQRAPVLKSVVVYNNLVEYTGWDGIQISNAINVKCYNNTIRYDSRKKESEQMSGIMIGGGTSGSFYNNTIQNGYGNGIVCYGTRKVVIQGNIINTDTSAGKYAIYINDKLVEKRTFYKVDSNTGMAAASPCIQTQNRPGYSTTVLIHNSIVYYKK